MKTLTLYQRLKKNLTRRKGICLLDWLAVHRIYPVDYRTIEPLENWLQQLVGCGRIVLEKSHNRGGRRGRDIMNARTISSYRTHNEGFAFKLVRYHRASGSKLEVIGDLGRWHMFFESNFQDSDLAINDGEIKLHFSITA